MRNYKLKKGERKVAQIFEGLTSLGVAILVSLLGIIYVLYLSVRISKKDPGSEKMVQISEQIHTGAMAFLFREYRWISVCIIILGTVLFFTISKKSAIAFFAGAFFSLLAGFIGMKIATRANTRTAQAASSSFNSALQVAFPSGVVMGISVVSLGLLGLSVVLVGFIYQHTAIKGWDISYSVKEAIRLIVSFSMGASLVALFARVGGGIYTKAADVGADLVGKVEAGIPEDDPRNPAVIADNVGDNVGDVAGMGADLYESYVGAIVSALIIAMSSVSAALSVKAAMLSILIVSWGIISSIVGVFFVRTNEKSDPQKALERGMLASAILLLIGAYFLTANWYGNINMFYAVLSGLIAGIVVGYVAMYYTSGKTVAFLAGQTRTGVATNIIQGVALGMKSTAVPLVSIAVATVIAYQTGGIFGISLAAIGMLSITGMTVAVDAYGPVADNAAGIAEMAHMGEEVRKRCERLDAVGNTTAAVAKGFAIGSAALTALALFIAYSQTVGLKAIDVLQAKVIAGVFIGGAIPFVFCAATMQAVGRAAFQIVEEVRRQFKEIPGLMEGKAMPDSYRCVDITTQSALKEMLAPGIMAVLIPIIVGSILGVEALGGFLVGSLVVGVPLAIFLANAGGAWDNAKKYVEEGNLGGKGSQVHKDTVIGDTVGDPFKDTAGPSLNILLKLMSIVAVVFGIAIGKIHLSIAEILPFLR